MKNYVVALCVFVVLTGCGGGQKLSASEWTSGKVNGALMISDADESIVEPLDSVENYTIESDADGLKIYSDETHRYYDTHNSPNHSVSLFEDIGEPYEIMYDMQTLRVPLRPIKTTVPIRMRVTGITHGGIVFDVSNDRAWDDNVGSGWIYEVFQSERDFGMDDYGGHTDGDGLYHYHGIPQSLVDDGQGDLVSVGYAGDGFEMFVSRSGRYTSSWRVKEGRRPSGKDGPDGLFDGTYTRDYEFVEGAGSLDLCNGTKINDTYRYIITRDFPYIPRCLYGLPDESFQKGEGTLTGQGPSSLELSPPNPTFDKVLSDLPDTVPAGE